MNPQLLRGIIPPLATPLVSEDALDRTALARLIEHVVAGGVSGIFIMGTTGEGPSLPTSLQHDLIDEACRIMDGRLPVLVGISSTVLADSIDLADHAAEQSAAAVVAAPPYYQPLSQRELTAYFIKLASESPLPLLLYNIPSCSKLTIEPETAAHLAQYDKIIGLKDSGGDTLALRRMADLVKAREDFSLLVGPEELIAESVPWGVRGAICAGANLFPRLYVQLLAAAESGDIAKADQLQQLAREVGQSLYHVTEEPSRIVRGVKGALSELGILDNIVMPPLTPLSEAEQAELAKRLVPLREKLIGLEFDHVEELAG